MTDIQKIEQVNEMEKLRDIIPDFAKAVPEPFIRSVQQDVVPPAWNKIQLPNNAQGGGGAISSSALVTFIAAEQLGNGDFAIRLITANGTSTPPP